MPMDFYREAMDRFQEGFARVQKSRLREPAAALLATHSLESGPSLRTVLLRGVDERGFVFYTNSRSRKGKQLARHPRAALGFYWDGPGQQVLVEGRVEGVSEEESDAYWATRARPSQIGAWASLQSRPLKNRSLLLARVAAFTRKFAGAPVPRPRHWHGFRVIPDRIEFWQAKPFRLHERVVYEFKSGQWTKTRLFP